MTRYEAHIEKDWHEVGLAHLLVLRIRDDNSADFGVFLVDAFCLGVKDAIFEADVPASEVGNFITDNLPEDRRERLHPACAKKLIEGAIAYAESLGFAPHRDYRKARRVLSGIDAALCPTEFTFGCNGRPRYIQGPNDSDERVERVLAVLEAGCGPDGFDYELAEAGDGDAILTLREHLIAWLDAEPPEVPRFYEVSGMVTALHLCPRLVMPTKLLGVLWGPDGRRWADAKEAQDFAAMLMVYWNHAGDLLRDALAPDAPDGTQAIDLWAADFPEDDPKPMTAAMVEWARGFLHTTELWPDAWGDALTRPELAAHWEVVRWWAEITQPGNADRIADAAEAVAPRTIAASVTALARALRPAGAAPEA